MRYVLTIFTANGMYSGNEERGSLASAKRRRAELRSAGYVVTIFRRTTTGLVPA